MRPDPQPIEHVDRGHEGGAVGEIDDHRLAVEILHAGDRARRQHMHFLVEQFCHIDELVANVVGKILALEKRQRVLADDAGIDAPQQQNVRHRLNRSAAHHRQHPQRGAVIEHGSKIGADLGIGAAERAGHQADGVGVHLRRQIALGGAVTEYRLEGVADAARIDPAAHWPNAFPSFAGKAHHLHLLERRMIARAGVDGNAGHQHRDLQAL